jgi:hypothetical protein
MKTKLLGGKIRGKIEFLGGEKETWRVGREILIPLRVIFFAPVSHPPLRFLTH